MIWYEHRELLDVKIVYVCIDFKFCTQLPQWKSRQSEQMRWATAIEFIVHCTVDLLNSTPLLGVASAS